MTNTVRKMVGIVFSCALSAVLVFGSVSQQNLLNNMPSSTDSFGTVHIPPEETPLGNIEVLSSSTNSKKTTKTVKLKKMAKRTYVVKHKASVATKTKTQASSSGTIETKTKVKKQVTDRFTKKSKKKKVVTTVTTTVTKTLISDASNASAAAETQSVNAPAVTNTVSNYSIRELAPMASENILAAYEKLHFTAKVDSGSSFEGCFDSAKQLITLKRFDDNIYHELGHFVAFVAGNADSSSSFASIYNAEKGFYTGRNESYVLETAGEYFAESYRQFIIAPEMLAADRPQTYAAIESAVNKVTDSQIQKIQMIYGSAWK